MADTSVSLGAAARTWLRIGLLSFGGPAGQISVMHRILVEEKRWISEPQFLHALNFCMLLPGPEAQQLATYVGWLLHGVRGGLVAGLLFIIPGFLTILALSMVYVLWHEHPVLSGVLLGLKAAVIVLVVQALIRIARHALASSSARVLAALAFLALALFDLPFPLVVLGAGAIGWLSGRMAAPQRIERSIHSSIAPPSAPRTFKLLSLWLPMWAAPVVISGGWLGSQHVLTQLGIFFSKMAVVTFGGAYAALTYVAQQAVERFAWVTPAQMADGLGLAETTPGPLILVLQFVGFLAAHQHSPNLNPMLAGVLGALITVWVTFVPCFLFIFLGAPHVERLRDNAALSAALAGISAAVVGVIANLALWFTIHAWFAQVDSRGVPAPASWQPMVVLLTAVTALMLFALRWGLGITLAVVAALGAALGTWG